jgi:DNA-binding NarL/FixJ family response regulator
MKSARLRVLIADKQPFTVVGLRCLMGELGHIVVASVHTAREAVAAAARYQPDLLLLDVELDGEVDGIAAAQEAHERFGVRSVFFSGSSDPLTRSRAELANPIVFLDKSSSRSEVASVIRTIASLLNPPGERA